MQRASVQTLMVVSVTYGDHCALVRELASSLAEAGFPKLVLVCNGVDDATARAIAAIRVGIEILLLRLPSNLGPAAGYAAGLTRAFANPEAEAALLLDHDNVISGASAERLKAAAAAAPGAAIAALRPDRAYLRAAAEGVSGAAIPRPGAVFNHDILELAARLARKIGLRRARIAQRRSDGLVPIGLAPYGGLFLPRAAYERAGPPRADFVIYADDFEYADRLSRTCGLFLAPDARVTDREMSWNQNPAVAKSWRRLALARPDFRVFYAVRNAIYLDMRRQPRRVALLTINAAFFLASVAFACLRAGRWANLAVTLRAFGLGVLGRLGPHPRFPLPGAAAAETRRTGFVLSERLTYLRRTGAGEYLDGFSHCLSLLGYDTDYLHIGELPLRAFRIAPPERYLARHRSVRFFGCVRLKDKFYRVEPAALARATLARIVTPKRGFGLVFAAPSRGALRWVGRVARRTRPEIAVANYFNAAVCFEALEPDVARIVLSHDVLEFRRRSFEAAGEPPDFDLALIEEERKAYGAADLIVAIKPEEAEHLRKIAPKAEIVVAPPMRDPVEIRQDSQRAEGPPRFIFVGGDQPPNVDALSYLLFTIWPRLRALLPDAELDVVGAVCATCPGPWPDGANRMGFVDDLADLYAASSVALIPVRFGSGVKIKLVEALCAGLPVVATRTGAEGVDAVPPEMMTVVPDDADPGAVAEAMLRAAARAASDPTLRREVRAIAASRFSHAAVAETLRAPLARALARAHARAAPSHGA